MLKQRERDGALAYDAKREIVAAWRGGRLKLTAEAREYRAQPGLRLKQGEPIPQPKPIAHGRVLTHPDMTGFKQPWDWQRSRALRYDAERNLIEYREIVAPRAEFKKILPPKDVGGHPTSKDLVIAEADRLRSLGWKGTKKELANRLSRWLAANHPNAPPMVPKVVERHLPLWRRHKPTKPV